MRDLARMLTSTTYLAASSASAWTMSAWTAEDPEAYGRLPHAFDLRNLVGTVVPYVVVVVSDKPALPWIAWRGTALCNFPTQPNVALWVPKGVDVVIVKASPKSSTPVCMSPWILWVPRIGTPA